MLVVHPSSLPSKCPLTTVEMRCTFYTGVSAQAVARILDSLPANAKLTCFMRTGLRSETICGLLVGLRRLARVTKLDLSLSRSAFSDLRPLTELKTLRGLQGLRLQLWEYGLTDLQLASLADAIKGLDLTELNINLGRNDSLTAEAIGSLLEVTVGPNLTRLDLDLYRLWQVGEKALRPLSQWAERSPRLCRLTLLLTGTSVGNAGFEHVFEMGCRIMPRLKKFTVSGRLCGLSDELVPTVVMLVSAAEAEAAADAKISIGLAGPNFSSRANRRLARLSRLTRVQIVGLV